MTVPISDVAWHWTLTPREALGGYCIAIPRSGGRLTVERTPLAGMLYQPFYGDLTFQYGVSSKSLAPDMQYVRQFAPDLPDPGANSRDPRSGILAFSGERIVGYYIIDGLRSRPSPQHRVWVDPEYYGRKIGARILFEYQKRVPRCPAPGQMLNPRGCETFLALRPMLYHWAEEQGIPLSDAVKREMETGREASDIRRKIAWVRETGHPQYI